MPNLYGVANAPSVLSVVSGNIGAANIFPATGTETNLVDSGAMVAPSQGYFYPVIWACFVWQAQTSVPTGVSIAGRIGAGADFDTWNTNMGGLTVGGVYTWTVFLAGTPSQTPWQGAGSHIFLTALQTGGAPMFTTAGARAVFGLMRAPDQ